MTRLKRVVSMAAGGTPTVDDETMWDADGLPWVSITDMTRSAHVSETDRRVSIAGRLSRRLPIGSPGTLLFAMYASVGATAVLDVGASWNQAILGMNPVAGRADIRFVRYWLEHLRRDLSAVTRSNTQDNLNAEQVGNFPFPNTKLAEQQTIADYLDRETARIDALIAAKLRMEFLLEERWQRVLEGTIQELNVRFGSIPLKRVCREIVVGIVVTPAAWYAENGVVAIRGTNVSAGKISLVDVVYLTAEGHHLHPKSTLRAGDVVVVRTGQAGTAAVVPPELDGANCIDLVIIRPSSRYDPHFLEYVLNSDWMQKHIDEHAVGTIQSHFNLGAASSVPVPLAPVSIQGSAVALLAGERSRIVSVSAALATQVRLLRERRRALITAAVTGQIQVPVAV